MLDGTDPARMLCLTFTRAAAAEMANRLDTRLAEWATMPPGALAQALVKLTGQFPDEALVARARQLFARVLDTPGGIKIATIHAFCQTLLRRFPLEAGVSPEFAVIEERGAGEALAEAAQEVIIAARSGRDPALAEALAIVADYAAEERFAELMGALASERGKLRRALSAGHGALRHKLSTALGVPLEATAESLTAEFCAADAGDEAGLRAVAAALAAGSDPDRKRGAVIDAWCAQPQRRREMLAAYQCVFLTNEGQARQPLITKPAATKAGCDARAILAAEAERLQRLRAARAAVVVREASCALARLGEALLRAYDAGKRLKGALDFDDLVLTARDLLARPGVAPWVLFKLDGGLDHILIDEAQDTNPEQWEIVAALAEEFFAGEGARDRTRTIFAVGDAKQSIYSFQRADPQEFLAMRRHFQERVANAGQDWQILPLEISFRSTEPVLRAVDAIFRQTGAQDGVALDGARSAISPPAPGRRDWSSCGPRSCRWRRTSPIPRRCRWPTAGSQSRAPGSPARSRRRSGSGSAAASGSRQRPPAAPRRHHGAGASPRRLRRRIAARAESAQHPGRRRRPPGAERAIGGAGSGGARPVSAVSGGRSDPGRGAEGAALRHRRGHPVRAVPWPRRGEIVEPAARPRRIERPARPRRRASQRLARARRFRSPLRALRRNSRGRGGPA